jgi:sirohydrochlorin ferrochelatase
MAVAHGTQDLAGRAAVSELVALVSAMKPSLNVELSWLDHASPRVRDLAERAERPLVAVPLLLSTGYHVRQDIPQALSGAPVPVMIARRLGPHPLLVDALAGRLAEAGWAGEGAELVLAAAGSSRASARQDVDDLAALVSERFSRPVTVGYAAAEPGIGDVVRAVRSRASGPVVVLSYLIGPGRFADVVADSGADLVPAPLGAHPSLARLVLVRYDEAVAAASPDAFRSASSGATTTSR